MNAQIKIIEVVDSAVGGWSEYRKGFEINSSSILTKLIQEAGRWCERYASDLFISWEYLLKAMEEPDFTGGQWAFGMRSDGVDNLGSIIIRITEPCYGYSSDYYRAVWGLDITVNGDTIRMKLGKVDMYDLEKSVNKKNFKGELAS